MLQVADTLTNIGPIRDITPAAGGSHKTPGAAQEGRGTPQLLAASGSGKQGTLSVLQRSVVPHVITQVPLAGTAFLCHAA